MTHLQISKHLDIPLTTLNDWKKKNSNRNKLYQLLINLEEDVVQEKLNKKDYYEASSREQTIYAKFFKELEPNELDEFIITFNVSKRNIKSIYLSSPFRTLKGIAKIWDRRFRLKSIGPNEEVEKNIPTVLQNILNKRNLTHV